MTDMTKPQQIYLADYRVPNFLISHTDLHFSLFDSHTEVRAELRLSRNLESTDSSRELLLNGTEMTLVSVAIDGVLLGAADYQLNDQSLTLLIEKDQCLLTIVTHIKPHLNTSLEGLYQSRSMYCTQCEAEGFRKIIYYQDRPDVMAEFTTTIEADKTRFPVLLSNGNLIKSGDLTDGRHFATWHDPFKKPAYLFALVAGDLAVKDDTFVTVSGRTVLLRIFVEEKDLDKLEHAMDSLKRSMRWDEEVYGREYDLDIFMIVAVDDFNMGAMENKGLNIFNTSCVLAKPETTTDVGFQRVEGVVAHEYFHNWSGNRVTCRDWFQLSLKEGFTVYRDAEFSADMGSRTVKRVEDVALLRTLQFAEDASPMAHAVRPASYIEISNFYTLTIYEKGAELVRMVATLLGPELFRKGSDLYFERHDGQAVTTDDFVQAMADVSGRDFTQFKRWYTQAGTPRIQVEENYDADAETYSLTFTQSCPPTPECADKKPFHIPVAVGLLGTAGDLPLVVQGQAANPDTADNTHLVLELTQAQQTFIFEKVGEQPIPSLLRGFSAPVKLSFNYTNDQLAFLMSRDSDGFNRYDASQQLALRVIYLLMNNLRDGKDPSVDSAEQLLIESYRLLLADQSLDAAMVAYMLTLPSEAYLSELATLIEVDLIHQARELLRVRIATALKVELEAIYQRFDHSVAYAASAEQIAARLLKNTALSYLMLLPNDALIDACYRQYQQANNMTDVMAALTQLVNSPASRAKAYAVQALNDFFNRWQQEALVINQWFSVQASASLPNTLATVKLLQQHVAYDAKNPNKIRALVGAFSANAVNFHCINSAGEGEGYQFIADEVIRLNKQNPQIASRILTPLTRYKKYDPTRQQLMKNALERILAQPELSPDVYEVVMKSLA